VTPMTHVAIAIVSMTCACARACIANTTNEQHDEADASALLQIAALANERASKAVLERTRRGMQSSGKEIDTGIASQGWVFLSLLRRARARARARV